MVRFRQDPIEKNYADGKKAVRFLEDGSGLCLLRRDDDTRTAQLGRARPPYVDWTWLDLGVYVGGPHMLRLPDGRFVAAGRMLEGEGTQLCWLDVDAGTLQPALSLPSGGDTSYPGLVWHDGLLWVSYYSSHEEKTAIYLARVRVDLTRRSPVPGRLHPGRRGTVRNGRECR